MNIYRKLRRVGGRLKAQMLAYPRIRAESNIEKDFKRWLGNTDHCYIAQNCVGGRFYNLEGRRYTSPTVGLWFEPTDFMKFCQNLSANLAADVFHDVAESDRIGYPVGRVNEIKIYFEHYASFDEAAARWRVRSSRVRPDDVFVLLTDRDGFSEADFQMFNALPTRKKILFSHSKTRANDNVVYIPGREKDDCVGNLYNDYYVLNQSIARKKMFKLLRQGG